MPHQAAVEVHQAAAVMATRAAAVMAFQLLLYSLQHALEKALEVWVLPELWHKLIEHLDGCLQKQDLHCGLQHNTEE
jgi:hypothetical protein